MYAVIFTAKIKTLDTHYVETAKRMRALAFSDYGCQDFHASLEGDTEIAVSYWESLEAIQAWKNDLEHLEAQALGKTQWYRWYKVEITKIEHRYESTPIL